jgi:signal transduction histidine kinase/ligand-binding sensor domain-containing protein/DNA-binding NarL/FixJ family response regulator
MAFRSRIHPAAAHRVLALAISLAAPQGGAAAQALDDARPGAPRFVHESWSVEDGLPLNSIRKVLQGRDGYVWIATLDGLARFDGVRFTVFNASGSPELPSTRFISLYEARDGSLWLQTETWDLLRFRHGRFTHFGAEHGLTARVYSIYEEPDGTMWLGTGRGVGRLEGDRFVPVAAVPGGVHGIVRRADGSVWLGTDGRGVYRVEDGRAEHVVTNAAPDTATSVWHVAEDPTGRLLIAGAGLWAEDPKDGSFGRVGSAFVRLDRTVRPISGPAVDLLPPGLFNGAIGPDGTLWFAHGTRVFTEAGLAWDLGPGSDADAGSFGIYSLTVDREGGVWLGTWNAGVHRLKPALFTTFSEPEGLANRNTSTVFEDGAGSIWVGTRGGLSRIDPDGGITSGGSLPGRSSDAIALLSDRPDRLWVGTGGGLLSCTLPAVACRVLESPGVVASGSVRALYADSRNRLWVGFGRSVAVREDDRWTTLENPSATVRAFAEAPDGAMWMGTNGGGLLRYHDGRYTRIDGSDGLPSEYVRALHVDADGWLWVGTEGRGLARLDPRGWGEEASGAGEGPGGAGEGPGGAGAEPSARRIAHIGTEHGLYDPAIHQILADGAGRLWMNTNRGVFWVARSELLAVAEGRASRVHSTYYTERDGMRNREGNGGTQPAGIRSRDGRLWFPTQDGVVVVDPARAIDAPLPSPVVVEQVVAGDSAYTPVGEPFRLGPDRRDVQIDYTAPGVLEPDNVRFRYRLEPYDADWVEADRRRSAFYTRLPPGHYTFRVIASTYGGEWNEPGAPIEMVLAPRFHETRTARALLVLALGLLVGGGFQWRLGNLRRRERQLVRAVDDRTAALQRSERQLASQNERLAAQAARLAALDQAKTRLFADLSHEFRTPLTLILGPLRSMLDGRHGTLPPSAREQADLMHRNGQRLHRLVNQVLDLMKLEAGQLGLVRRPHDLVEFVRGVTLAFAPFAERRGVELEFRSEVEVLTVPFDADQLEKVLLNLISNALKFTARDGEVEVSVGVEDEVATIAVRDTGLGIPAEELPRIFERFFQVDAANARRHEGTGIGLTLARDLVELHGGEITVDSAPGAGSTFTVRLPVEGMEATAETGAQVGEEGEEGEQGEAPDAVDIAATLPSVDGTAAAGGPDQSAEDRTTVLLVDDNADVRQYVRSVLASSYRVIEAADGRAGLERVRADLPDLVVADVMMPNIDGIELARALKLDAVTEAIPIVLLTARAAPEDQIAGLEAGADTYLVKPFEPGVLEATVSGLLAQRRRLRERFRSGEATPPAPAAAAPEAASELESRLRPLVEGHLTESGFGPDELAESAGITYHQLYYALRKELDVTPSRFIRGVRVECAAELLVQGAGSVTEIAYSVGFESLSYFSRAFRERFGTSPTQHVAARTRDRGTRTA